MKTRLCRPLRLSTAFHHPRHAARGRDRDGRALARMRAAGSASWSPRDEPLIVIVIDEAASLSSYADRDEQNEFRRLTGMMQSKGRAAGVSVIAALQDPSKETMPNRQLFPVRIGLRLDEPTQTAMVPRARSAGPGRVVRQDPRNHARCRLCRREDAPRSSCVCVRSGSPTSKPTRS